MRGQPHLAILELHKRYGDVVRTGPNELSFSHNEAWKEVCGHLKRGQDENEKDPRTSSDELDKSILSARRDRHGQFRRLLSGGFSARAMAEQQPLINKYINLFISRLREHGQGGTKVMDASKWFEWTTFDIIGDLSFAEPFGCLQNSKSHPWVDSLNDSVGLFPVVQVISGLPFSSILKPLYFWLMTPKGVAEKRGFSRSFAEETLKKRIALGSDRPDFVDAMLKADKEAKLTDDELRDNSVILTTAGSETTATTLAAVTYFLGTHPEVLAKLSAEVRSAFQHEDDIDINSVQNLRYMLAVLKETMRMYPAVALSQSRHAPPGGVQIAGEFVAGGTILGIWQYSIYHNPAKFLLPDSFIPDRWLDDKRFDYDEKALHQPFSYGPRNCIGMKCVSLVFKPLNLSLAYAEMRIILARIIWNFDIELAPESRSWTENQKVYFFWQKPPLWTYFKPRNMQEEPEYLAQ
ncbi:trichothecene c-15 hydroxylase [Colletotrichum karsti]|uniref:Trichothecene c-15 hydroxylase n=1 Tax=Colletotrichum karsti TaxID=1095194 RepID=A0A9P6IEI7_9PEZI|nr:trichothecene c-15 hydroxylase [Colletotrichum karsti]KAF9877225.1 trichothecene c-15 hydroxylase [Colletotrichum karsti]